MLSPTCAALCRLGSLPPCAALRRLAPPMTASSPSPRRGLDGVVAGQTRLSHVDGQAGQLIIGGYELKELAGKVSFEEAAHLLWRGALPRRDELARLREEIASLRTLPDETLRVVRAAARIPPIDALRMGCATLSLDLANPDDISPGADIQAAKLLVARFPTIVAAHARLSAGKDPIAPRADLPLAANFLYMVHGKAPDPIAARAIDTYWVTVIDHGMNASTFAARVIASTRSDMVSAVTGAIGALKGPLHGGAPGPVLDMLKDIKSAERADAWVRNELAGGGGGMGFGPRGYKARAPARRGGGRGGRRSELGGRRGREPQAVRPRAVRRADGPPGARGSEARPQSAHQRRVLHGTRAAGYRPRAARVRGDVRMRTRRGLECARHRAARRRSSDTSTIGVHRTEGA